MESEEEEIRKAKVRRWMVACKVSELVATSSTGDCILNKADQLLSFPVRLRYEIALLYLQQSDYNLGLAVEAYMADEKWEKENPMEGASKGRTKGQKPGKRRRGIETSLSGQL